MRIISRGIDPREKEYRGTCTNCRTVFEIKQHEADKILPNPVGGGYILKKLCPVCSHSVSCYERDDGKLIPSDQRGYGIAWSGIGGDGRV